MTNNKRTILSLLFLLLLANIAPVFGGKISKAEFDRLRMVDKLLKAQIGEMETEFKASPALDKYRVEYLATVACKTPKAVSAAQIAKILDQSRFVFLGDEHTTAESQKNTINVLNLMKKNNRPVTLVLEWIDESHQEVINQFLAGQVPGTELRKKIAFDKDWGFSWTDYSKILAAAKKLKVPILLVERLKKRHSLSERDTYIAGKIAEDAKKNEQMRYLTVYGEYHLLGPGHLTEKCSKLGLSSQVILVGDAPEVYWKLLAQTMDPDQVEFAQLKGNVYFIRNGTPLERSMSYRNYLMKILGYKASDFEDRVGATDIIPKAGAAASFDELHQTR
ncbi:MAG: ChaN family lipoprotein [Candidatus Rifleibacteriota bacterium]